MKEVLKLFDKDLLIKLHLKGYSNQEIANQMGISRPTVIKYVKQYNQELVDLEKATTMEEKEAIIIKSSSPPKYHAVNRKKIKLTPEVEQIIEVCLEENEIKRERGMRKLVMKNKDIHELLISKKFDISYRTVCHFVAERNQKQKEAYIRQEYPMAKAAEFDWGDVTLYIDDLGCERRFKIGVFTLKYSDYRFAYLYTTENTESFLDIHTKFIEHIQGVPEEIVYDNALVQVQRLAGREKKPTEAVMRLSNYYGFNPRYTNYYRGNEKGHVERSVEVIRRKAYSKQHHFQTIADAVDALLQAVERENTKLKQRSQKSAETAFAEEKAYLNPARIPLDVTQVTCCKVNKYSLIYVDCNFYSVPDYLVQKEVKVHKGVSTIKIFYNQKFLFQTQRILGRNQYKIDIQHYLGTMKKKPGAIAHSLALKQATPWLQQIFHQHYTTNPKDFIYFLELIQDHSLNKVKFATEYLIRNQLPVTASHIKNEIIQARTVSTKVISFPSQEAIQAACQDQLSEISTLYNQGGCLWKNS